MLKDLINKLKNKKQKLESFSNDISINNDAVSKTDFEITISNLNGFYKVEISDYIKLSDFCERIKLIDIDNIADSIFLSVLFNSGRQSVNSGVYFIFNSDNKTYNFLINEEKIIVAERTFIGEEKEDRVLSFPVDGSDFHYFRCRHDKIGSTYATRYYSKNGTCLPNLELSKEEFVNDSEGLVNRLKNIDGIDSIYDIDIISDIIFGNNRKK